MIICRSENNAYLYISKSKQTQLKPKDMTNATFLNFAKDTDALLGLGAVESTKMIKGVYFEFTMNNEGNAKKVQEMWGAAFKKLNVMREGNTVTAG